jgi:hypothetical protein
MLASSPENPPVSGTPSDDEILDMLVHAEQHGERATLEKFSITQRQLCEWRALVGGRDRSADEVQRLVEDGSEAERKLRLAEFLRSHNMTEKEYKRRKQMAQPQSTQSGRTFRNWDTEHTAPKLIWDDSDGGRAKAESSPDGALPNEIGTSTAPELDDAPMKSRVVGSPLTRAQLKYLGNALLANGHAESIRRRWRIGSATFTAIKQGSHRGLPRELAARLKANYIYRAPSGPRTPSRRVEQLSLPDKPQAQVEQAPVKSSREKELEKDNAAMKQIIVKLMLRLEGET